MTSDPDLHAPTTSIDEQTCALLSRARRSSGRDRERLQNEAIEMNLSLARRLAARYRNRGQQRDDLEQVANLALVKAVRRFDPRQGAFGPFVVPTILGELKRYFRDHTWMVRPGRAVQEDQSTVTRTREELTASLGREPEMTELVRVSGLTRGRVNRALTAHGAYAPTSLDAPATRAESGPSVADRLGQTDGHFEFTEDVVTLAPALAELDEADRELLQMRYGQDRTQQSIAETLGISQMQVSRRLARVIAALRARLEVPELSAA